MNLFLKWLDRLFYCQVALAAAIAFAMGILVFASAVMRYLAGAPLGFSDELVSLMFVSSAFLCLPYATRRGLNIKLDLLTRRLGERQRRLLLAAAGVATVVILVLFSVSAVEEITFAYEIEEVTDVAELPVYPFKALVLFSAFSTALAMLVVLVAGPLTQSGDSAVGGLE